MAFALTVVLSLFSNKSSLACITCNVTTSCIQSNFIPRVGITTRKWPGQKGVNTRNLKLISCNTFFCLINPLNSFSIFSLTLPRLKPIYVGEGDLIIPNQSAETNISTWTYGSNLFTPFHSSLVVAHGLRKACQQCDNSVSPARGPDSC